MIIYKQVNDSCDAIYIRISAMLPMCDMLTNYFWLANTTFPHSCEILDRNIKDDHKYRHFKPKCVTSAKMKLVLKAHGSKLYNK